MAKTKINITIDDDLLDAVDDYCDKNYLNRSMLISQSLVNVLNQQKIIDSISNVSFALKKCAETGSLDADTKKQMETFEALTKLMLNQ